MLSKSSIDNFFFEFKTYLSSVNNKSFMCSPFVCGDFNFHLQNDNDVNTLRFKQLCLSHNFYQHKNVSTHIAGNTLDAVLIKDYDNKFIANIDVIEDTGTSSDHYLITFDVSVSCLQKSTLTKIVTFRDFSNVDLDAFVQAINSSDLCNHSKFKSLDHALILYDTVLNSLLNAHAPLRTNRVKTSAVKWWNSKCQQACRE